MQSTDKDHFFETDASQAQRERKAAKAGNKHGNPVEMKSKILAAVSDPASPLTSIFIAESAGYVRRVNLGRGAQSKTIFAGSWDKDIWSWDIESTQPRRKYSGHSDFVKSVITARVSGRDLLISGGADKKIMVWDVDTGRRIHTIQDPATTMLAVQHLATDPVLSMPEQLVLVCASSDPHIRRWKVSADGYEQMPESFHDRPDTERLTIEEHDTSVSRNFLAEDTFLHGDYVRAVLVTEQWVVTAGRDENVKVWDRATGKLYCTLDGHFEEVTDLVLLRDSHGRPQNICSVSIDRTIRTWPLAKAELDAVVKEMQEPPETEQRREVQRRQWRWSADSGRGG
ncbi:hypothetical protein ACCO45_005525 [Purpureocillium lilacinum]|uniref:Uncharacterized protein n=1 Tax=Purpureocillium lilacinum TaxID=33203 RepID=A0ACC4DWL3_PURLI